MLGQLPCIKELILQEISENVQVLFQDEDSKQLEQLHLGPDSPTRRLQLTLVGIGMSP